MKRVVLKCTFCLLALALLVTPLGLGCGKSTPTEGVELKIGWLTDLSGAAAAALKPVTTAIEDYFEYMTIHDPIPGAYIKNYIYDIKYDPSRDIPGYQWAKGKGAMLIHTALPSSAEALKAVTAQDKIPVWCAATTSGLIEPTPQWAFGFYPMYYQKMRGLLQYLTDQEGTIKLGFIAWTYAAGLDEKRGIDEFMAENPGKVDLVDSIMLPVGTASFTAEAERLKEKECDYILVGMTGAAMATFMSQYRAAGGQATFVGEEAVYNFIGLLTEKVGKDALDGTKVTNVIGWWTEETPLIQLANELMKTHPPEDADYYRYQIGGSYYMGMFAAVVLGEVFRDAVARVGAENVDGQAVYDALINFKRDNEGLFEGYGEWSYSETKRIPHPYVRVWEYDAASDELVRLSDWIALPQ